MIAAKKPTGTSASTLGQLLERAEDRGRVDDRLRVRHGEDGAVAAGGRGARSRGEVFLVLAPGRAQVHVRVDERRREHLPVRRGGSRVDRRDDTVLYPHRQRLVDPLRRIDDADVLEGDGVLPPVPAEENTHW